MTTSDLQMQINRCKIKDDNNARALLLYSKNEPFAFVVSVMDELLRPPVYPAATVHLPKASFSSQKYPHHELEEHCVLCKCVCLFELNLCLFFLMGDGLNMSKVLGKSSCVHVVYQVLREKFNLTNDERPGDICRAVMGGGTFGFKIQIQILMKRKKYCQSIGTINTHQARKRTPPPPADAALASQQSDCTSETSAFG